MDAGSAGGRASGDFAVTASDGDDGGVAMGAPLAGPNIPVKSPCTGAAVLAAGGRGGSGAGVGSGGGGDGTLVMAPNIWVNSPGAREGGGAAARGRWAAFACSQTGSVSNP